MNAKRMALLQRLEKYPHIEARLEALLDLTENESGEFDRADDAETHLITEIRKMGQETLQAWAYNQSLKQGERTRKMEQVKSHTKKNFTGKQHSE